VRPLARSSGGSGSENTEISTPNPHPEGRALDLSVGHALRPVPWLSLNAGRERGSIPASVAAGWRPKGMLTGWYGCSGAARVDYFLSR
jgi:hypothetical protein